MYSARCAPPFGHLSADLAQPWIGIASVPVSQLSANVFDLICVPIVQTKVADTKEDLVATQGDLRKTQVSCDVPVPHTIYLNTVWCGTIDHMVLAKKLLCIGVGGRIGTRCRRFLVMK